MNKVKNKKLVNWVIYMVSYAIVLIFISAISDSLYIDTSNYGMYAFITVVIIQVLNKTIKPILFLFTLPITTLTLGLFYPVLNVIILKIVDIIMGNYFNTSNVISLFFIAIAISLLNILIEGIIIKPIIGKED